MIPFSARILRMVPCSDCPPDCSGDHDYIALDVECLIQPGSPAIRNRPPEDCYPGDPDEVDEVLSVEDEHGFLSADPLNELTDDELSEILDQYEG